MRIDELLEAIAARDPENRAAIEEMVRILRVHMPVGALANCEVEILRAAECDQSALVVYL